MTLEIILLTFTGLLVALLAGVFFGFAVAVNGGLHQLKDGEYVRAMQSINQVIQNPLFLVTFMGPVVLLPLLTYLFWQNGNTIVIGSLLGASALYIVGTFGITVVGNVPLNNQLAKIDTSAASESEIKDARTRYEAPWNQLHTIRTFFSILSIALVLVTCIAV